MTNTPPPPAAPSGTRSALITMSTPLISDERVHIDMFNCHTARGYYKDDRQYIDLTQAEGLTSFYCKMYEAKLADLRAQLERARKWLPDSVLNGDDDDE